jgi:PAS domain S-box-containing protein
MESSTQLVDIPAFPILLDPGLADDTYLLSALLDHTTDRIYFKDLESRFVKINRNKAQSLHLSDPDEAIGKTDNDFFADNHAMKRRQDELDIIQSGLPLIDKVEREDWPDGRTTWTSTSKMPLVNSAGRCIGTFGISRDITERGEAEIALSNAHRDAELFINSVPSILIGLDADGRIKRWNVAAAEAFGISKAAAFGKLLGSCGIKWLREDIDSEIMSLSARTEPIRWDLRVGKDDGEHLLGFTLRWIRPFASDNAELLIVGTDITERKRADEDLLWKTAFLEAQANSTGDAILIVDPEGKKLLQNQKMEGLFKVPQEIASRSDEQSLLEHALRAVKDPDRFMEKFLHLHEDRDQTSRDEVELVDGTVMERYSSPVLGQHGKYYGRIWTFREITERKQIEKVLRQLSMAVEQSPVSVEITDLQGKYTYVNRKFTEASGYAPDEVLGKSPNILKSGYSSRADYQQLWETIAAGREWRGLFQNRKKSGEIYWESAVIRSIEDQEGAISHFLALKEDITEKLALEAQLRQSQKLEAIGQLAAGIAHEINTPIQYVGDNARFLKDAWQDLAGLLAVAQKLRNELTSGIASRATIDTFDRCSRIADVEYLARDIPIAIDQTLAGVQRVARIVGAMKEFSHPGSQEKRAVDLNRAIETTVTISHNEWKYVAEVQTQLDPNLPLVPCLAGEINQVLLNLVVNAAHAIADVSPGGGSLGVITISTRRDGDWVEISVGDTGTGIPDGVKEKVFDPFFTTKDVGKGSGQGLMLAHTVVVRKHAGRIWFDSQVGNGTTFFVRLPLSLAVEN